MRSLSLSTGSLSHLLGKEYHDFEAILSLMKTLHSTAAIDGFEFQKIAEWDSVSPPRDEYKEGNHAGARVRAWQSCSKYKIEGVANSILSAGLPILSIHANRDVGICLCAGGEADIKRGEDIIHETLFLCEAVRSQVAVFHFWDTWEKYIDVAPLIHTLDYFQSGHPDIRVSVENVPTSVEGLTPFDLANQFKWVTLDTRWACRYDELERFHSLLPRIVNIHLRGRLADRQWVLDSSTQTFDEVINLIRKQWRYSGLITLEPEGGYRGATVEDLVDALKLLRKQLGCPSRSKSRETYY